MQKLQAQSTQQLIDVEAIRDGVVILKSGETRAVEVSWIDGLGAVSNIEVIPEIDILNQ